MIPNVDDIADRSIPSWPPSPTTTTASMPYLRDDNLARPWAVPGTPGLVHRIGGLEKQDVTGNISYDTPTTSG